MLWTSLGYFSYAQDFIVIITLWNKMLFFFSNDQKNEMKVVNLLFFSFLIQSVINYFYIFIYSTACEEAIKIFVIFCYFHLELQGGLSNLNYSPQRWNSPVLQNFSFLFFFKWSLNHQFFSKIFWGIFVLVIIHSFRVLLLLLKDRKIIN